MSKLSNPLVKSPLPPYRKLRAFAFDPVLSRMIETSDINEVTLKVPWDPGLKIGPVDSYLEVVDRDPASNSFYAPVDLMDPHLLAQDGLPPAEGNPQFHQQMVYAIARTTIYHFELALGRRILWAESRMKTEGEFAKEPLRLRIYPHALREANAYYDPDKKALLFGYFPASSTDSGCTMPGETVFTCISHDIVVHETTHAIIDGLHPRFIEPSNVDVAALHEALADVIALFQHFTNPDVLKHQIARTGGDLEKQNLLGELAFQFGQAVGNYGALRSAIGHSDPVTHEWIPHKPNPTLLAKTTECHKRGAIIVAAIFDAFLAIYKTRIKDLLRIASGGTGVLPEGAIHPDLVNRLADEAAKTARHMLQMCIRALDYTPSVDPNAGDYLRAVITADRELVTDDPYNYRLAVIEAFRQWGIYPRYVRNLSVESLVWHVPDEKEQEIFRAVFGGRHGLREIIPEWDTNTDLLAIQEQARKSRVLLHTMLMKPEAREAVRAARLVMENFKPSIYLKGGLPALEVHSVRPARRTGPDGQTVLELVIDITQRRMGYLKPEVQEKVDEGKIKPPRPDFILRGGCTLLVDPGSGKVRYCIYKDIMSNYRLDMMRKYLKDGLSPSLHMTYFGNPFQGYYRHITQQESPGKSGPGLFALLHRSAGFDEAG
jgi:hypothetical protein